MLGALDTGSSFEGMGAAARRRSRRCSSRRCSSSRARSVCHGGVRSFEAALVPHLDGASAVVMWLAAIVALMVVIQVEAARMPVDDPTTHLELTMVHEVMILDHSGPELAALQLGAAIKLFVGISVVGDAAQPARRACIGRRGRGTPRHLPRDRASSSAWSSR